MFGRIGFRGYSQTDLVPEGEGAITLSPTNMNSMFVDYSKCTYLSWKKYFESPEIMVNPGDVLLVKTASVGKCSYVNELPQECTVNPQILVLKEHKDSPLFLTYLFQTAIGQTYIELNKVGSTIPTLSEEKIGKFSFAFPPISEQLSIVSFLNSKTKLIDDIIAKREKQIELLEEMKSTIISRAVTKGLNPKAKMKDSGIEWIGEVPEHWKVAKTLFLLSMPITDGPHETPKLYDCGIPFISAEAISGGEIDFSKMRGYISEEYYKECCKKYIPQIDDIYMIKSGATTGRIAKVKTSEIFTIWSPLAVFRVNKHMVTSDYLYYVLKSDYYQRQVELGWNYGTQQNIGMRTLEKLLVAFPEVEEQRKISSYLDQETIKFDTRIAKRRKQIELLQEYKQALITAAVTGKIDVREYIS